MRRRAPVALPRGLLAVAAAWVLIVHPIVFEVDVPLLVTGLIDWSAHLATALILLGNLPVALHTTVTLAALAASMLIDLDHLPQYLGSDVLTEGTVRPYGHSLAAVAVAAAVGAAARGLLRQVAAGVALGVLAHLVRDVSTGPGIAPLWPVSDATARIPFWVETALLGVLAARAWYLARALPHVTPDP